VDCVREAAEAALSPAHLLYTLHPLVGQEGGVEPVEGWSNEAGGGCGRGQALAAQIVRKDVSGQLLRFRQVNQLYVALCSGVHIRL